MKISFCSIHPFQLPPSLLLSLKNFFSLSLTPSIILFLPLCRYYNAWMETYTEDELRPDGMRFLQEEEEDSDSKVTEPGSLV